MKNKLTVLALVIFLISSVTLAGPGRGKAEAPGQNQGPTIADLVAATANAEENEEFTILLQAVLAADQGVLETLSGKGQFTVFAPTDAAFGLLVEELVDLGLLPEVDPVPALLSEQDLLTEVLLYHVARGSRYSEDVLASRWIRTLNKSFIFQDGGVLTDQEGRTSNIIDKDIPASNGVIHVIDTVILPDIF